MMQSLSFKNTIYLSLIDVLATAGILFLPAQSHLVSYPLYLLEPMRVCLFAIIFFSKGNRWNPYMMALTLPMISSIVSGHPVFPKNIVMSGELLINVWMLHYIYNRCQKMAVSVFTSILVSKTLYYVVKFFVISAGFLDSSLFSTNIYIQIIIAMLIALMFKFVPSVKR